MKRGGPDNYYKKLCNVRGSISLRSKNNSAIGPEHGFLDRCHNFTNRLIMIYYHTSHLISSEGASTSRGKTRALFSFILGELPNTSRAEEGH